ncbi:hypothetical protein N5C46_10495 [Rossellomorea vietnamensis]|uniref:Uncharacterized protein n=1 Tax=Rossellomorea vietnamensis TaxID=218284 RepID=A0ACD4CDW7_9BACI|nr:hypothetical protein [Rossellomorea vietnamensis]UXH46444.1 hypothetical protein N5C46_10495 [Rossellomorea vietnamensis]
MNEIKMRSLVKQLHSADPGTRYEALGKLYELKGQDDLKIRVEMLKDMVKEAASTFPERVDVWDNPSLGLVEFVCDYPMPEIIDEMLLRFDGFDPNAKVRALECLLLTKDEGIFQEIHDKTVQLVTHEEVVLPVEELCEFPVLLKGIVDKTIDQLESPYYKYMYYDFITAINESGVEAGYKRARILPLLLADYAKLRDEYLKYYKEYRSNYAYQSWKESYFRLRYRLNVLIGLMNFYYSEEAEGFLKEAVSFKDPRISTNAVVVAMNKNIPVEPDILQSLSTHVESAEMMYWGLAEHNKEHLFPVSPKQPVLAKAHLFNHLVHLQDEEGEELHIFPENIQVVDSVETVNSYGQPLRYYLMSFSHGDEVLAAWVGGHSLEEEGDSADMWEGTHTDLKQIQNRTVEEHKQHFLKKREEYARENEETVYYESSPSLPKGLWFFYAILISHWIRVFINGITETEVYISVGFTLLGGILTLYELWKKKRSAVVIVGRELRKVTGEKKESIPLQEIKKVTYDKKQISVYNKENVLTMKVPLRWVEYGEFYYVMVEQTGHLRELPYIEE